MSTCTGTLAKLQILETLYRSGYYSEVIERTLDKLIALEQERAERELAELQAHLQAFEAQYPMSSEEFYQRYEQGELGDSADFMEWGSFYDMRRSVQQHLAWLAGETAQEDYRARRPVGAGTHPGST